LTRARFETLDGAGQKRWPDKDGKRWRARRFEREAGRGKWLTWAKHS
jgi:hypothetical protein